MTDNEYAEVRDSSIHGKGLFARKAIPANTNIAEYTGEKITKEEGDKRSDEQDKGPGPILVFELDDEYDIDASVGGSIAKFANHGCDGNCEVEIEDGRIWLRAAKDIGAGEELTYDYNFSDDAGEHTCNCGSQHCRGTINQEEDDEDDDGDIIEVGDVVGAEINDQEFVGEVVDINEDNDDVSIRREDTGEVVTVPFDVVFVETEEDEDDLDLEDEP